MVSQPIWIGIVIIVFFIGIGASYAHFANTYDPMSMKFQNQGLFDQMMSNNPRMSQQWMDSGMMNPQQMQQIIMTNMHDADQMQMMEDMMADMMNRMQTDPELEQAMMEHMKRMNMSRENMMGQGMSDSMMGNDVMKQQMQGQTETTSSSYVTMVDGV